MTTKPRAGPGGDMEAQETRLVAIVTGASRGFGRAIAVQLARQCVSLTVTAPTAPRVHFHAVLLARDGGMLADTRQLVLAVATDAVRVTASTHVVDLGDMNALGVGFEAILRAELEGHCWDQAILVNNAGSLGDVCYSHQQSDLAAMRQYFDLNVTSPAWLTSRFLASFDGVERSDEAEKRGELIDNAQDCRTRLSGGHGDDGVSDGGDDGGGWTRAREIVMVNVSSLAAVEPFESWGLYCAGKAARDMALRVVAKEYERPASTARGPVVKTLNYAPGPLRTAMMTRILRGTAEEGVRIHAPTREFFETCAETGEGVFSPDDSAAALAAMIVARGGCGGGDDSFETGAHVDYVLDVLKKGGAGGGDAGA